MSIGPLLIVLARKGLGRAVHSRFDFLTCHPDDGQKPEHAEKEGYSVSLLLGVNHEIGLEYRAE